jgi:serine/threonine protein kinase
MKETLGPDLLLRPGSLVGSWRVEGYAGRGTFGAVYRARRAGVPDAPLVALKVAVFPDDPRFLRERELLSRTHHPAVPRLLDWGWWVAGPDASHPYLVLEWVRGLQLYEWARMHPVTQRQVLQVVEQVAGALAVMHLGESLHRDVRGDNLLVEPAGWAHLVDFGSGTWKGAPPITESLLPPNTPEYRSPEALRFLWNNWSREGARYAAGPADDLYALGVSLYRLVTRVYPSPGTEPDELKAHIQGPPAWRLSAHALNARVGLELSALIEQMLAGKPEQRGTAGEVAEAARVTAMRLRDEGDIPLFELKREAARATPRVVPARVEAPVSSWASKRAWAMALLMLVGVSAWWESSRSKPEAPTGARAEVLEAGTRGLGESTQSPQDASQESPAVAEARAVALEMPPKPLDGQRRAPCRFRGDMEINGGCWIRKADVPAPCGIDGYEWQGMCYEPAMERSRPKTSKDAQ